MPELIETDRDLELLAESPLVRPKPEMATGSKNLDRNPSFGYSFQLFQVGFLLWLADVFAAAATISFGFLVTVSLGRTVNHFLPFLGCVLSAYTICIWSSGLYPGIGWHPAKEIKQLFRASLAASLGMTVALLMGSSWASPYIWMLGFGFPLQLFLLPLFRSTMKSFMRWQHWGVPFYFLGERQAVMRVYRDMNRFGWTMLRPLGRFAAADVSNEFRETSDEIIDALEWRFEQQVTYLGTPDLLSSMAKKSGVFWLFVVAENPTAELRASDPNISQTFPGVICIDDSRSQGYSGSATVSCGLTSGIRFEESLLLPWPKFLKRSLDVIVASSAIFLLSPLLIFIALMTKFTSPGPIFYSHGRIGRGGRAFKAWKFRSMRVDADRALETYLEQHPELREEWERDHKLREDPRITRLGRVLRKLSLDELPQLWNVLTGDMSLVGPRPIVHAEIIKYGDTFRYYLRVTPGITGLWQISGRNNTTYQERLAYDEAYVRNWSPWLDLYILLRTIRTVLLCEGAY